MKLDHPELSSRLAAEYVLGTMTGRARRRFATYLKRNPRLAADVERWESYLTPLAERLPGIDPPDRVWSHIEARIAPTPAAGQDSRITGTGFWNNLGLWRALGLGASGLAAALLAVVVSLKPVDQEPMMAAVLSEDNNTVRLLIEQPKPNTLQVRMVKPWRTDSGFAHELWVIPKDGAPRSLGVINDARDTRINVAGLDAKLADGALLAVSLEPPGGSPTGQPTGKVVCKGSIAWMPVKPAKAPAQA